MMHTISLGNFVSGQVGADAITESVTQLSQKTLIATPYLGATLYISVGEGYCARIYSGNYHKQVVQFSRWFSAGCDQPYVLPGDAIYMRVSIQRADGGVITEAEAQAANVTVKYESSSDMIADNREQAELLKHTHLPVILHLTDIHGDVIRTERALSFARYVGADAVMASGDLTAYLPTDWGTALFEVAAKYPDVKFVYGIGNHDARSISPEDYCARIYKDYFQNNPHTPNGETYYHLDLAAHKLRLISVNQQEGCCSSNLGGTCFRQAQVDWLLETLRTTPAGYGVIMMYHSTEVVLSETEYPGYMTFFQRNRTAIGTTNKRTGYTGTILTDIVDAFMLRKGICASYSEKDGSSVVKVEADFSDVAQGVEFIAHLTGHSHSDSISYIPGRPTRQLMMTGTCTTPLYGEPGGYAKLADVSDLDRAGDTAAQDAYNAYMIDRAHKTVQVLRIGAATGSFEGKRTQMTIPYSYIAE